MSKVFLQAGQLATESEIGSPSEEYIPGSGELRKRARFVHTGEFDSMNGPVTVTKADLEKLVETYNAKLDKLIALYGSLESIPRSKFPPFQNDHEEKAVQTIGRAGIGKLVIEEYVDIDGETVDAIYGDVLILGEENCQKVHDGRWGPVSIGADFETGDFQELSNVAFAAAPSATLLAKAKLSKTNLKEGEAMDKKKLKEYLMKHKKLSEKEADDQLAKLGEEELSKLASEVEEKEKLSAEAEVDVTVKADDEEKSDSVDLAKDDEDDKDDKKEKLSAKRLAAKKKMDQLASDFRKSMDKVNLAKAKLHLSTKLTQLRASMKITPAEIKKIDIAQLAAKPAEVQAEFLKGFEIREPVIFRGMFGNTSAEQLSEMQKKRAKATLAAETRASMSFTSTALKNTRLAEGITEDTVTTTPVIKEIDNAQQDVQSVQADVEALKQLIDAGQAETAKAALDKLVAVLMGLEDDSAAPQLSPAEAEKQLTEVSETVARMSSQFREYQKLAAELE